MKAKDYYTIGFEEKIFKVPKTFLNKYKQEAIKQAERKQSIQINILKRQVYNLMKENKKLKQ